MIIYAYTGHVIHCTCIYVIIIMYMTIRVLRYKRDGGTSAAVGVRVSTATAVSVTTTARGLINYIWSRAFVVSGGRPSPFLIALLLAGLHDASSEEEIIVVLKYGRR